MTYFYNGNKSGYIDEKLEKYLEVPSDIVPFEQRPWMKGAEITDALLEAIESGKYRHLRCNFPNGDMVGHTGSFPAVRIGVEAVDLCLGRLKEAIDRVGGVMVITADHGNADDMLEHAKDGSPKMGENGRSSWVWPIKNVSARLYTSTISMAAMAGTAFFSTAVGTGAFSKTSIAFSSFITCSLSKTLASH